MNVLLTFVENRVFRVLELSLLPSLPSKAKIIDTSHNTLLIMYFKIVTHVTPANQLQYCFNEKLSGTNGYFQNTGGLFVLTRNSFNIKLLAEYDTQLKPTLRSRRPVWSTQGAKCTTKHCLKWSFG